MPTTLKATLLFGDPDRSSRRRNEVDSVALDTGWH